MTGTMIEKLILAVIIIALAYALFGGYAEALQSLLNHALNQVPK